jgi:hypothetical protein
VKRLLAGRFQSVSGTVKARRMTLALPYAPLPPLDELRSVAKKSPSVARLVKRLESGEKLPATRPYTIATWAFGRDMAMVFLNDEVVVDYALRIKREMDGRRLWINAYTDDVSNYVVSDRLIGEGGYEVNNSVSNLISHGRPETVQPSMEDQVVAAVRVLLPDSFRVRAAR